MPDPLKILYTIPNFDTAGSGRALLNIAKRLDSNQFEAHICCSHNGGELFNEVIKSGIPVHLYKTTLDMVPRIKGFLKCIKVARYLRTLDIDLIHSFHYGPDYSEPLAAFLAGIPWIYTKKNMNWGGQSKNGWKLRSALAKYILAQNKDMLIKFFLNNKKVVLVPRGVDIKEFSHRPKDPKLMKKYQIRRKETVILSVANLVPVKGINILLDAFSVLFNKYDTLKLLIVGDKDNDYGRSMEARIINSKLSEKVYFVGKVDNVKGYLSIADIFVLPSLQKGEGSPVALLEAMIFGLPIIGSDVPGIRDILEPFPENMFPAGDADKLTEILDKNIKKGLQNQSKLFRSQIMENYSIDSEVLKHQLVYKHCLIH
ncbi:MAG: hypothetical protein CMG74_07700 [Candidatus Marinimicrobia bacterium]|nr:hypothetical protein [Candidatus Neomarinimicrobiota bacterium]